MRDKIESIFIGLFFVAIIWLAVMMVIQEGGRRGLGLITECQKELPRNQACILMAVPEEVEK